jgi:hypothetical protein
MLVMALAFMLVMAFATMMAMPIIIITILVVIFVMLVPIMMFIMAFAFMFMEFVPRKAAILRKRKQVEEHINLRELKLLPNFLTILKSGQRIKSASQSRTDQMWKQ